MGDRGFRAGLTGTLIACWLVAAAPAAAGVFAPPEQIDTGASATCPGPDIAAAADGATTIVYQKAGLTAATRPAGGSWTTTPFGPGQRGALDMSADGDALYAYEQNNFVRTASKSAGGGWSIPAEGETGTFAATSLLTVAAGLDSEGKAVVAWLDRDRAGGLRAALRDA